MRALTILTGLLLTAAAALPAAGHADTVLGALPAQTVAVAAGGGDVAWWGAAQDGEFRLMIRRGDVTSVAGGVAAAPRPLTLTAGFDRGGRTVFLFSRCDASGGGCEARRYTPATGREEKLALPGNVTWAVQRGSRLAWVRGVVVRGIELPRARCDVPYTRAGSGPARRLDRGRCGAFTSLAMRGDTIAMTVDSSAIRTGDPRFTSQLRLLQTGGGPVRVLRTVNSGEESNRYGGAQLSAGLVMGTHHGTNPRHAFVRVSRRMGTVTEVRSGIRLAGPLAVAGGTWIYATAPASLATARIVSGPDPFGAGRHALPPVLTLVQPSTSPRATQPFPLTGRLFATVVARGATVGTEGIPDVPVSLGRYSFAALGNPALAESTGLSAVTGADGSWQITVPPPLPPGPFFGAVAAAPGAPVASDYSVGTAVADVALSASATSVAPGASIQLTGTVDPAQPGRSVTIRRRDGETVTVSLDPSGRHFSAPVQVSGPTTFTAVLPAIKFGEPGAESSYGGTSPAVTVTTTP